MTQVADLRGVMMQALADELSLSSSSDQESSTICEYLDVWNDDEEFKVTIEKVK